VAHGELCVHRMGVTGVEPATLHDPFVTTTMLGFSSLPAFPLSCACDLLGVSREDRLPSFPTLPPPLWSIVFPDPTASMLCRSVLARD
jgi:hypothetical protein